MECGVALEPENASAWDVLAALERQAMRAIGFGPFRCVNCDARFYRFKHADVPESKDVRAA